MVLLERLYCIFYIVQVIVLTETEFERGNIVNIGVIVWLVSLCQSLMSELQLLSQYFLDTLE